MNVKNIILILVCVHHHSGFELETLQAQLDGGRDIEDVFNLLTSLYTDLLMDTEETSRLIQSLQETVTQQQNEIQALKEHLGPKPAIAFTATMTHGYHLPGDKNPVPFGLTIANYGGHYSPTTNQFRCPVAGLYLFTISLHSGPLTLDRHPTTVADIMVGDQPVGNAFCGNLGTATVYLQCATSVVVRCPTESFVWVRARGKNSQFAGDSEKLSNFAGVFIQSTE